MSIKIQTREESGVKWVSVDDMLPYNLEMVLIKYMDCIEFGMMEDNHRVWLVWTGSEWVGAQEPIKKWCHIPE